MLAKYNIKSVALPPKKIACYLPPVKEALGLKMPGIYSIPCECGKVYVGQSGRTILHRIKKHDRHQTSQQWPNIVSTMTIPLNYKTPSYSPPRQVTWTD
jgi:hypothetical protein